MRDPTFARFTLLQEEGHAGDMNFSTWMTDRRDASGSCLLMNESSIDAINSSVSDSKPSIIDENSHLER